MRGTLKRDLPNLAALTGIQLANALLPIVAYPVLLGVVGAQPFSRIVVTEAVALMAQTLVTYSFDVDGIARVASLDPVADRASLSDTFSSILFARLALLATCGLALLLAAPFLAPPTRLLLASWFLLPLAFVLQSTWFYQGLQRNLVPAAVIITSRLASLALLMRLVTTPDDYLGVPLIVGGSYAAAGAVLLAWAVFHHRIRLRAPSLAGIGRDLRHGRAVFVGSMAVALYRDSNVLVLNWLSTSEAVAAYAIAEKCIKVFQAGARPLNQIFFPKVVRAISGVRAPDPATFRIIGRYTLPQVAILALAGSGALLVLSQFSEYLPARLQSAAAVNILTLITIMTPAVLLGVANFMFGTAGLNSLGRRRYLASVILATGVCSLLLASVLVARLGATGAAVSFVSAELLLFLLVTRAYRA